MIFRPLRTIRFLTAALLVAATVGSSQVAHAWNMEGHMTIGAIAEARLNEHAKREVARLLPMVKDTRSPDFMTASVWMDDIRADGVRLYDRWHIDGIHHSPDGTPTAVRQTDNAPWSIAQNRRVLENEKTADEEKARALRFLLHVVQDIHQPLHCGSRFTKEKPKGDGVGSAFLLENSKSGKNLHALWDACLGTFNRAPEDKSRLQSETRLCVLATTLTTKYPESSFPQVAMLDPEKWVEEGTVYMKNDAYPKSSTLDNAYMEHCLPIAERQATLAGYRLARLLNSIWP